MDKKILNANEKYRQMRGRLDTSAIIGEPAVNENGFSVYIEEHIGDDNGSFELFVRSEEAVQLDKDCVAVMLAALVLDKYKYVHFDFDIGQGAIEEIKALTKAKIKARSSRADNERQPRENWVLNYSGGIDSTALRLICPELRPLSIDYTGTDNTWEQAEREMFGKAQSTVVKTNAHEFLFPRYPIGYYNLCALLHADGKQIRYAVDGRIMTDTIRNIQFLEGQQPTELDRPDEVYGVRTLYPFVGMTKVGTQWLVANLAPENYAKAIEVSIGAVRRKVPLRLLLDEALTGKVRQLDLPIPADGPVKYGESPLRDFYALYLINRLGVKKASAFVDDIPREIISLAKSLSLDFYEKYDPRALKNVPQDFAEYFSGKLAAAGIALYNDADYAERAQVLEALGITGGGNAVD